VNGFDEHTTDRRRLAAAASLARATGVDYAVAYRHLANGMARMLIESRAPAPRRRSPRPGLSPVEALYILQEKWQPSP
jgi:transposase